MFHSRSSEGVDVSYSVVFGDLGGQSCGEILCVSLGIVGDLIALSSVALNSEVLVYGSVHFCHKAYRGLVSNSQSEGGQHCMHSLGT
jgi:hypothetical protein